MKFENLEHSQVKVIFTISPEDFESALDKAFDVVSKDAKIKGFRKGHVPRSIFEKTYGVESLYQEALNGIANNKMAELYKAEEAKDYVRKQCGPFSFDVSNDFERGKEFEVSLIFDVLPEFNLPTYKGLSVKAAKTEATEEDVQALIDADLKPKAVKLPKENETIEKGDIAIFDFEGSVDGVKFDGGTAENYELVIGSGQFIPGFEDQMIGMKSGETKDVNVTFPEEYQAKDLAGKPAVFKVVLHEVKEEKLPELTDDFVKELNIENVSTVEEYKASKKQSIEDKLPEEERNRQINELFDLIVKNTAVELPSSLVKSTADRMFNNTKNQITQMGIPFDYYLQMYGTTEEKFRKQFDAQAENQTIFSLVFSKILEEEKLEPTEEEIKAKAETMVKEGQTADDVLKTSRAQIIDQLSYEHVVDLVLGSAVEE